MEKMASSSPAGSYLYLVVGPASLTIEALIKFLFAAHSTQPNVRETAYAYVRFKCQMIS